MFSKQSTTAVTGPAQLLDTPNHIHHSSHLQDLDGDLGGAFPALLSF